jgi:hypothetical protein
LPVAFLHDEHGKANCQSVSLRLRLHLHGPAAEVSTRTPSRPRKPHDLHFERREPPRLEVDLVHRRRRRSADR